MHDDDNEGNSSQYECIAARVEDDKAEVDTVEIEFEIASLNKKRTVCVTCPEEEDEKAYVYCDSVPRNDERSDDDDIFLPVIEMEASELEEEDEEIIENQPEDKKHKTAIDPDYLKFNYVSKIVHQLENKENRKNLNLSESPDFPPLLGATKKKQAHVKEESCELKTLNAELLKRISILEEQLCAYKNNVKNDPQQTNMNYLNALNISKREPRKSPKQITPPSSPKGKQTINFNPSNYKRSASVSTAVVERIDPPKDSWNRMVRGKLMRSPVIKINGIVVQTTPRYLYRTICDQVTQEHPSKRSEKDPEVPKYTRSPLKFMYFSKSSNVRFGEIRACIKKAGIRSSTVRDINVFRNDIIQLITYELGCEKLVQILESNLNLKYLPSFNPFDLQKAKMSRPTVTQEVLIKEFREKCKKSVDRINRILILFPALTRTSNFLKLVLSADDPSVHVCPLGSSPAQPMSLSSQ